MKKEHVVTIIALIFIVFVSGCDNKVSNPVGPTVSFEDVSQKAAAGKMPKVAVCHETGNGTYRKITVNENALPAHMNHGDLLPGSEGIDENCSTAQVPPVLPPAGESLCPCFDEAALAALDLTFGGSAFQVVGSDNGSYTSAYGLFFGSSIYFRAAEAGQTLPEAPYSCKLLDDTTQLQTEMIDITPVESETCRQMIRNAWPNLF